VAQTVGEHTFYSSNNMVYGKAMEAAKSNALMRCCKDLGVASELWDPQVTVISMLKHSIWHDIVQCNQGHLPKCTTGRLGWMFWKWIGFFFQECSLKHPVLPCLLFGIYLSGSGDIPVQGGNKLVWRIFYQMLLSGHFDWSGRISFCGGMMIQANLMRICIQSTAFAFQKWGRTSWSSLLAGEW